MMINLNISSAKKADAGILLSMFFTMMLFLGTSLSVMAQNNSSIKGTALTADGQALTFASVALHQEDGTRIKAVLSDSLGAFSIASIPKGKFHVKVSSMGFITHQSEIVQITDVNRMIDLGVILMKEESMSLGSVNIRSQKKIIEQHLDKTIINVENSILSEGNTALELLERAPGVKVDDQGKITLKGRPGVSVMINGKLTYLSPSELSILLKGTNAASISKIEIISNPSSKFDAAGNAGIINILMKKNQMQGLNGSVSVNGGAGRNARYGSGLNLNYRNKNVNVFGSYNYAYRGETEYLDFTRRFYTNGTAVGNPDRISNQHTKTNEPLNTNNFRMGLDLDLDSTNNLSFVVNGNIGKYLHDSKTTNQLNGFSGNLISDMLTTNYDQQNWKNLTYTAGYLHKFEKKEREFSADADYASNSFTSNLNLDTYNYPVGTSLGQRNVRRGYVPAKTNVYIFKTDYKDQFGTQLDFESGLKSSFINSDNNLVYENLSGNDWIYDVAGSNHFRYKEQIHAGYISLNQKFNTLTIQAGLRGEYTQTVGNQITSNTIFNRNYFQLFPNVSITKPLSENHQLQLAYSKRIERPDYGDLNPFRVFRDPLLYYEGNPNLKPELTQSLMANYVFKEKYTVSLNYSRTKDVITWITGQNDATNTTFESPQNLNRLVNYGLSLTGQTTYFSWWNASNFANVFKNIYNGDSGDGTFDNSRWSYSFNTQNSFKVGSGYSFELNAYFNSKSAYGISTENYYWAVSTAMQKNVFGDKGSLKVLFNDVFQSSQYKTVTRYQNIDMNSHVNVDSRRLILSFSYRFGNQKLQKERKTGGDDILKRVKGGQ
ncbi:outer membrane beta-barrel family protein [Pedobacter aquatilis]|uniref:outer membrane beta-barrel family protein n=1 Tax=Pedobacter aquatilis TaxID=351343 RepID=UPI00292D2044|nr:outer membrane beta-barrel family protein [Pedobacter aquatilis]